MAYEVSKSIIEENLKDNKARIYECLELPRKEVVKMCIANTLEENFDTKKADLPALIKCLARH